MKELKIFAVVFALLALLFLVIILKLEGGKEKLYAENQELRLQVTALNGIYGEKNDICKEL